jgi:predicted aspartyl protease
MNTNYEYDISSTVKSFQQASFTKAKNEFIEILARSPDEKNALIYAGYIALLENRLKESEEYLDRALKTLPNSKAVKNLLYNVYYRQDDFMKASLMLDSKKSKQWADGLDYFRHRKPYEIVSQVAVAELDFLVKDPLPLIHVSINGAPPVNFLIDTGGGELIIDTEYAKSLGLKDFGAEMSMFGGGKKSVITHSYIDTAQLSDIQIKNLPVILMDTRRFSSELYWNNYRVDGIIGTCMFYHFLTTLDYANNKIIFVPHGDGTESLLKKQLNSESYKHIPFWMAGDHFMLAKGKVNDRDDLLFFVDTGLAGNAFTCPKSTFKKYGFTLKKEAKSYNTGGGGKMKSIPFDIESLRLGDVHETHLHGLYGPFPPSLEKAFGFMINGLISHEFFRNHTVILDFSNMLMHIK